MDSDQRIQSPTLHKKSQQQSTQRQTSFPFAFRLSPFPFPPHSLGLGFACIARQDMVINVTMVMGMTNQSMAKLNQGKVS